MHHADGSPRARPEVCIRGVLAATAVGATLLFPAGAAACSYMNDHDHGGDAAGTPYNPGPSREASEAPLRSAPAAPARSAPATTPAQRAPSSSRPAAQGTPAQQPATVQVRQPVAQASEPAAAVAASAPAQQRAVAVPAVAQTPVAAATSARERAAARRAARRAAERRRAARALRERVRQAQGAATARQLRLARGNALGSEMTPVAPAVVPARPARAADDEGSGIPGGWLLALLGFAGAAAALVLRTRRRPVAVALPAPAPSPTPEDAALEAELQEIIAEHHARELTQPVRDEARH